jgi:hypothetical protein
LEYATNSLKKEPSQIPRFSNNNTRGLTTDRAAIAKAVAGFFLFHSFSQSKLIQAPRETEKITAEESTIQRRVLEKQNLEKGWI